MNEDKIMAVSRLCKVCMNRKASTFVNALKSDILTLLSALFVNLKDMAIKFPVPEFNLVLLHMEDI